MWLDFYQITILTIVYTRDFVVYNQFVWFLTKINLDYRSLMLSVLSLLSTQESA